MAEFTEVMRQRKRMCKVYKNCDGCPIEPVKNAVTKSCRTYVVENPQKAEEIIMAWAAEHPMKTNADKFREVFGFEPDKGYCPTVCPSDGDCHICRTAGFWDREYKEPEGKRNAID